MNNDVEIIKRRVGIDYIITITIAANDTALENRKLRLLEHTPNGRDKIISFSVIESDKIRFYFRSKEVGQYVFTIVENWNEVRGATAVDIPVILELVARTWMTSSTSSSDMTIEQLDLGEVNLSVSGGQSRPMTKEEIEKVLTGDITTHNHESQVKKMLEGYVKAEKGKGLSSNDFTQVYKQKVDNLNNFSGSIEEANKASAAATEAAKKATEAAAAVGFSTEFIRPGKDVKLK